MDAADETMWTQYEDPAIYVLKTQPFLEEVIGFAETALFLA
jgi:hypothetical protein